MARPTDWSPLAGSDPVPGDPQRISEEAAHLASTAQEIEGQVAQLRAIASGHSVEKGLHVDKLRSASGDLADNLDKVVGRYQKTSSALSAWVPELDYAQSQSLKALTQAQDAAARQRANQPIPRPSTYQPTPQDAQDDQARATALNTADSDLAAARQMLDNAISYRDQKGSETRNKIENAINDGVTDQWWDKFKAFIGKYAWLLRDIATVLEIVATILAIIALFVSGLAFLIIFALAVGLTALALLTRTLLAATGNGSWLDVIIDVIALATLGIGGGVFGKAGALFRFGLSGRAGSILDEAITVGDRLAPEMRAASLPGRLASWAGKVADAINGKWFLPNLLARPFTGLSEAAGRLAADLYPTATEVVEKMPETAQWWQKLLNGGQDVAVYTNKMLAIIEHFPRSEEIARLAGVYGINLWALRATIGTGQLAALAADFGGRWPIDLPNGQVIHIFPENPLSGPWEQWSNDLTHGLSDQQISALLAALNLPLPLVSGFVTAGGGLGG
jgi:hypothetical protein